jgi:hypothetical protein
VAEHDELDELRPEESEESQLVAGP